MNQMPVASLTPNRDHHDVDDVTTLYKERQEKMAAILREAEQLELEVERSIREEEKKDIHHTLDTILKLDD